MQIKIGEIQIVPIIVNTISKMYLIILLRLSAKLFFTFKSTTFSIGNLFISILAIGILDRLGVNTIFFTNG